MDVPYFIANLLCVFLPLFGIEVWRNRRSPLESNSRIHAALVASILTSSVLCTVFNFKIAEGASINLGIVALTLGFYLLTWRLGLFILALYILLQIVLSVIILSHGYVNLQAITTVLHSLPRDLIIVIIYAAIMCLCSILTRRTSFSMRVTGFVICLSLYSIVNYVYFRYTRDLQSFDFLVFAGYIVVFNFAFIIAARLVAAAESAHLRRMEEVRIEKLELISQIAASVAHEIRNPITVVQGFTQLMLQKEYDRNKSHQFLRMMQEELARAESVIGDYLHIAKSPVENVQSELNLSLIVEHMINVLQPYALAKNVTLKSDTAANLCIYGNNMRVTQAIMNLAKNAIEAHEQSGTVEILLKPAGDFVELKIMDKGKGIPASELEKLGQPYYSTKTKGTGLGLTLVYKVINDINGKIEVQSRQGEGTTFIVTVPLVKPK